MDLQLARSSPTRTRLAVATITSLGGVMVMAGALLTWLSARGPRPAMGMTHTALSRMLVYTYTATSSFWTSAAFAVLVLGFLVVIGGLAGLRTLTVIAALLTLAASGMWIGVVVHHYNTPSLPNVHYANPLNLPWSDLRAGAWLTITSAALGLISAFWLRRRIPAA
jgi:uncharacterized iron-regulated membrane protein